MDKLDLWWVFKLQANQMSLLSCSRRMLKLSHSIAHHASKKKARSYYTTVNSKDDNFMVCKNRFQPLMVEELIMEDFDKLEHEIQAVDIVPGSAAQTMGSVHDKNWENWANFDKALVKKKVDSNVIRKAHSCHDHVACKTQMGKSFRVIPLDDLLVYEGPETKNRPTCNPLELHKLVRQC